jgi:hypothetical protein
MSTAAAPTKTNADSRPAPIKVARLLVVSTNAAGIRNPLDRDHMAHTITAGDHGDHRLDIEYRPWMRHHRIARSNRVKGDEGAPDTWTPSRVWYVHEQLATFTPADEA